MVDWLKLAGVASGVAIAGLTAHSLWKYSQGEEEDIPGYYSIAIPAATGAFLMTPEKQREKTVEAWT